MNSKNHYDVIIVGAGIAGLVAAAKCEQSGFSTLLIESGPEIGGRVQTDKIDGFALERGFQVLIDSYEKAKELLDYEKLDLKRFEPGAKIFDEKGDYSVADPLRKITTLPKTALSRVGSLTDKFKLLQLTGELQSQSLAETFGGGRETTLSYLENYGFSKKIIGNFFRPFFGGIFLERELSTDAAMFRFVFRNFSKGSACLPSQGMVEIPKQLRAKLKSTEIRLNSKVAEVTHNPSILLKDGTALTARKIIIACNPDSILNQLNHPIDWNQTTTIYFSGEKNLPSMKRLIGLDARHESSINNFARHDEVIPESAPADRSLWSVTVRNGHDAETVRHDLADLLGIEVNGLQMIKEYNIRHALPKITSPALTLPPEQSKVTDHIHLAGDYLTNASIDGAMRAGESAAIAVTETMDIFNPDN